MHLPTGLLPGDGLPASVALDQVQIASLALSNLKRMDMERRSAELNKDIEAAAVAWSSVRSWPIARANATAAAGPHAAYAS